MMVSVNPQKTKKKKPEEVIREYLSISFWVMILYPFVPYIFSESIVNAYKAWWVFAFWIISIFATCVLSIMVIYRYKKKLFAIISLILSAAMILAILAGFISGYFG